MTDSTPDVAAIREVMSKRTPGEWGVGFYKGEVWTVDQDWRRGDPVAICHQNPADAQAIVTAVNNIGPALDRIEQLERALRDLISWEFGGNRYFINQHRQIDGHCVECDDSWPCAPVIAFTALAGRECTDACAELHTFVAGCAYAAALTPPESEGEGT